MENSISFDKTIMDSLETKITVSKWDETLDVYNQNRYKDAILILLDYIDVNIRKKYGNADETYFKVPHGSVVVEIEITDDKLKIVAPFLKIGAANKIPVFRRIAEINFSPLNLAQIKYENDELNFFYETPLHLCEPYKIYYVLEEICHKADNYDDDFIDAFKVEALHEPKITQFSADVKDTIWEKLNAYLDEAFSYIEYFDQKRIGYFNWDIISITLKRIEYYMSPQGKLRTDIEREVSQLGDSYVHINDRIHNGKQFLQRLKSMDKEELLKDFYISESFIPIKGRCDLNRVKQNFERPFNTASGEIQKGDYMGATLSLLLGFYDMFYYDMVPADVSEKATAALSNAAGKPWKDASEILLKGMDAIINEKPSPYKIKSTEKKGFFSSLFK